MKVTIIETAGVVPAMYGARLSRGSQRKMDSVGDDIGSKDLDLAVELITKGDEHAKLARFIVSWILVEAPRFWWQEMATYKIGMEWLSESTMYTLEEQLRGKAVDHVTDLFIGASPFAIANLISKIDDQAPLEEIKANLPEGFVQTRMGVTNAQTLKRILKQRRNHKLKEWREFCLQIYKQYPYPDLIYQKGEQ
jgi:thymidylate synthase ThyX